MEWSDAVKEYVNKLNSIQINQALLTRLYSLIDLTSLNDSDTESSMAVFSEKAISSLAHVAAVCVYPIFVRQMSAQFSGTTVKVATVANFPEGMTPLEN